MVLQVLIVSVVFIVRLMVTIYTYITLPIYYLLQKPWKSLQKSKYVRAKQNDPSDLYSPWVREGEIPPHFLLECETINEAWEKLLPVYGQDRPAIGFRKVLAEELVTDSQGNDVRIDGKLLRRVRLSDYNWMTYGELNDRIEDWGKGLLTLEAKHGERIALFSDTRHEMMIMANSVIRSGLVLVTFFSNLGDEAIVHGMNETEIRILVTTHDLLPKINQLINQLPKLAVIIYCEGPTPLNPNSVESLKHLKLMTISELDMFGRNAPDDVKGEPLLVDDVGLIMYTSGTGGHPKGVQITGRQVKFAAMSIYPLVAHLIDDAPKHIYIAYLPGAHILELTLELFMLIGGVRIGYANPFTLNETAPGLMAGTKCDLLKLRPTIMTTVPLVLDRLRKELYEKLQSRTPFSVDIFNYLTSYKASWYDKGYQTPILNNILCRQIQSRLGGRLQFMIVGGATLSEDTQRLIKMALNVTMIQGYGCTETTGAVLCTDLDDMSYGRVGAPFTGVPVRLADWSEGGYSARDKPNPRGEIYVSGGAVSKGYLNLPEINKEAFFVDENGAKWFRTGDIAEVFPDGTFKIIDRRKDLIKLSNGEYFSLGKIEAQLKNSKYIDNICVFGEATQDFLVALVVPNQKALEALVSQFGNSDFNLEACCNDDAINSLIYNDMFDVGLKNGLKRKEIPIRIHLCELTWSPQNGLLTGALKLRRKNIENFYRTELDELYYKFVKIRL